MLKYQPKLQPLAEALSANKIPSRAPGIASLIKQAEQLQDLNALFNACIPERFRNHFQTNGIDHQMLVLTCHSASVATSLRMHKNAILKQLNDQLKAKPIIDLKIKIRPKQHGKSSAEAGRTISKKNAQFLLEEAGHTLDQQLRAVLIKLAQRSA